MTSHTSTPPTPSFFEGYFIVLLSQKDQKVGSCDSPFRLKQCRSASLPLAVLLFLHNPAPSLQPPPAALRLGSPHRPRRGVGKYGYCIIFTKLALLDYIFCFLAVVLIPHSCVRQRTKNRLPAKETDADGFSAIHQKI